jgi:hypothetical protein
MTEMKVKDIKIGENVRGEASASPSFVASIDELGIIQPVVVDEQGNLIAGFRRMLAAVELGLETVPVHVRENGQRIPLQVAENVHRESLTDWELAQAALDLKDEGMKQAEVATALSISKKDVSQLQKAGKLDITAEQGDQFGLEGLIDLADAAKETELPAEDLASAVITGEARDMFSAVRHVQHEVNEIAIADELAVLQGEWADAGITVTMEPPDLIGGNDRHGYPKRDKNVLRVQEHDGYAGILIPLAKHIKLECHTIQIIPARGLGNTSWAHWCTNVQSHRAAGSSKLKATNTKTSGTAMSDQEKADRRAQREAKVVRQRQVGKWLNTLPNQGLQREIATFHALKTWREDNTRGIVLALIAIGKVDPRPKGAEHGWYSTQLEAYLDDRFGDDEGKRDAWMIKGLDGFAFIEHIDHWPHRPWDDLAAIEVEDA